MDMADVKKEMDSLERSWFAAHQAAVAAQKELMGRSSVGMKKLIFWGLLGSVVVAGVTRAIIGRPRENPKRKAAQARLEKADRRKQDIMQQIEALEESLLV